MPDRTPGFDSAGRDDRLRQFGVELRAARIKAGYSVARTSEATGISSAVLEAAEVGQWELDLTALFVLTALWDIPVASLFTD